MLPSPHSGDTSCSRRNAGELQELMQLPEAGEILHLPVLAAATAWSYPRPVVMLTKEPPSVSWSV